MKNKKHHRKLHPEDAVMHADGIAEGQLYARAFCVRHAEALFTLIATYADDSAHEQLDALRDAFWSVMERDPKECAPVTELRKKLAPQIRPGDMQLLLKLVNDDGDVVGLRAEQIEALSRVLALFPEREKKR
jgi:hypothetical protein